MLVCRSNQLLLACHVCSEEERTERVLVQGPAMMSDEALARHLGEAQHCGRCMHQDIHVQLACDHKVHQHA